MVKSEYFPQNQKQGKGKTSIQHWNGGPGQYNKGGKINKTHRKWK